MQSLTAGSMNFGSSPVLLRDHPPADAEKLRSMAFLGCKLCSVTKRLSIAERTLSSSKSIKLAQMNLSAVASSEKFTRVSMHREASGALTVQCTIHGPIGRDCSSIREHSLQFFPTPFLNRSESPPNRPDIGAFPDRNGTPNERCANQRLEDRRFQNAAGEIRRGCVTSFRLAARRHENQWHFGMDTLYICHAIIDLDGMNLFLK